MWIGIQRLLHPAMLEALTLVHTTGDGNCLWNAISNCLCGSEKYTFNLHLLTKIKGENGCTSLGTESLVIQQMANNRWSELPSHQRYEELISISM